MRIEIGIGRHLGGIGGFTLVELMISLVLLLFVSLALMQTALVSMDSNTKNMIRDEATQIAQQRLDDLKSAPLTNIVLNYNGTSSTVQRKLRSIDQSFSVNNTVADLGSGMKTYRMDVRVSWAWRGMIYNTVLSTVRGQ